MVDGRIAVPEQQPTLHSTLRDGEEVDYQHNRQEKAKPEAG
jgi:hypothetical protein